MNDPSDLQVALNAYTGTKQYHYTYHNWLAYTDGVGKFMEAGGAHWLIEWVATFCKVLRKEHSLMNIRMSFEKSDGKFNFTVTSTKGEVLFTRDGSYGSNRVLGPWNWTIALQNGILKLPQEVEKV